VTVVDASVVAAALLDDGPDGTWAADVLGGSVVAPNLMPAEVTQTIRRLVRSGVISADVAALALEDVTDLAVELFELAPFVDRVWELRDVATAYDSWYVALASRSTIRWRPWTAGWRIHRNSDARCCCRRRHSPTGPCRRTLRWRHRGGREDGPAEERS
jgi:predicted nucleic acid-binding protein